MEEIEKCDIFSIGVILFVLVKGKFPFISATPDKDEHYRELARGHYDFYWEKVAVVKKPISDDFKDLF